MYQLGTKWKLWKLQEIFEGESNSITLRGYSKEAPVSLPADFIGFKKRLSVEKISSKYCPTDRRQYLEFKEGVTTKSKKRTWGQVAGLLIDQYCKGMLGYFAELVELPEGLNYERIQSLAKEYDDFFWNENQESLGDLEKRANASYDSPERLRFLLRQTTKYELSLLCIDYAFNENTEQKYIPLMESIPINFNEESLTIQPDESLGLGNKHTPDFMIMSPVLVMGEIKSGDTLKQFHLTTIAGYAMAYESEYKKNIDFGVVYFLETHTPQMNFAQSYVFLIDDGLRKQFINARDSLYALLQRDERPPLVESKDKDTYCIYCPYYATCYPSP